MIKCSLINASKTVILMWQRGEGGQFWVKITWRHLWMPPKLRSSCCQWNIKRGLICRESEIKSILKEEEVDIMFLTETDTRAVLKETDYQLAGYNTILPKKVNDLEYTRIIALVSHKISNRIKVRNDLMSPNFPSIWLEISENLINC